MTRHCIVATAGHVDHGKSALVKALTGTEPDRLPEEKARGITLELGFAHLELSGADGTLFDAGIVDVPGHEDLVKTMVAGVGAIDLALLVVAADDGWMPQTEEHLQILCYLGVERAVVALTKADLAQDLAGAVAGVRQQLQGTALADAPIVPVSALSGTGLPELRAALLEVLAAGTPSPDLGKPRLAVDRVFSLRGIGTVITGTLTGGRLERGQNVVIQPRRGSARVRSVQTFNREVEVSEPGSRTALNLPDVAGSDDPANAVRVRRGDIVTLPQFGEGAENLHVLLHRTPRLRHSASPAARPLKDGVRVRIHFGTGRFTARLHFAGAGVFIPGEERMAEVHAEEPVFAFTGDRFIVRDWSEQTTLAGGVILDAEADRRCFRDPEQQVFLREQASALADVVASARCVLRRDHFVPRAALLLRSKFSEASITHALESLAAEGQAALRGRWALWRPWWDERIREASERIAAAHTRSPDKLGIAVSDLRSEMLEALGAPGLFELLAEDLAAIGFVRTGNFLRNVAHRPALPAQLQGAGRRLRTVLMAKPFDPPSRRELARDSIGEQALRFLIQNGEAVELNDQIVLSAEALEQAKGIIVQHLRKHERASVAALKAALQSNRRVTVPLLERLDREGCTIRQGDERVLRE